VYSIYPFWLISGTLLLLIEMQIFIAYGTGNKKDLIFLMIVVPVVVSVILVFLWAIIMNYMFTMFAGIILMTLLNAVDLAKLTNNAHKRIAAILLGGVVLLMFLPLVIFRENIILVHHVGAHPARCRRNLEQLCKSLEFYAKDHNGDYPEKLEDLTPNYLTTIPRCLEPLKNKWAEAIYRRREGFNFDNYYYEKFSYPQKFVLICRSNYHKKLVKDDKDRSPMYDSNQGRVY
jgi:hypothetical protein